MPTRINLYLWGAVREWVSGQADCKKTASEYASSRCIVWGAEMRPMLVFPISVLCCVALFPAKSMVPPYSASLHRLRYPMFEFVLLLVMFLFLFMMIVIILPLYLYLPSGLLCRPYPTSWTYKFLLGFSSSVSLLSSSFLAFRLVLSCRPLRRPSPEGTH